MSTFFKFIIAAIIIGIGVTYWYIRSTIEPVQFTPVQINQIEKTPS